MSARRASSTRSRRPQRRPGSRALQDVLYRSAKQDPQRRFHSLFDKVARSDILVRAWGDVRFNRGAPGIDGVSVDAVEESGVEVFLSELAAELTAGTYRPKPLRRVHIPKPGQPAKLILQRRIQAPVDPIELAIACVAGWVGPVDAPPPRAPAR